MIQLWIVGLQARFGNLAFRYLPALNMLPWRFPMVPSNLSDFKALRWIRTAQLPNGDIPTDKVIWMEASAFNKLDNTIRSRFHWVVIIDAPLCGSAENVIGLDGSTASSAQWVSWTDAVEWAQLQFCRCCPQAEQFGYLSNASKLQVLDLSGCQMTRMLDAELSLTSLTVLKLHQMGLQALPDWVQNSDQLRYLGIGWNSITSLPEWITGLSNLKTLHCAHTAFQNFPVHICTNFELERLVIRSEDSKSTKVWLAAFQESNSNCTIHRERSYVPQPLWITSLVLLQ